MLTLPQQAGAWDDRAGRDSELVVVGRIIHGEGAP
jgi:hypothetical protein